MCVCVCVCVSEYVCSVYVYRRSGNCIILGGGQFAPPKILLTTLHVALYTCTTTNNPPQIKIVFNGSVFVTTVCVVIYGGKFFKSGSGPME